ncbi:MAG: CHASE2 domain-containing protein, partial [Nitrospinota bacterium]
MRLRLMASFARRRSLLKRLCPVLGLTAAVISTFGILWSLGVLEPQELKSLDHRFVRYARPERANRNIVIVAIDEASLEHVEDALGRWPWPRSVHGYVVDFLRRGGARSIAFDILFSEPDKTSDEDDDAFAAAIRRAGNVTLAMQFERKPRKNARRRGPAGRSWRERSAVRVAGDGSLPVEEYSYANLPIPKLLSGARDVGYINLQADDDGPSRRLKPLFRHEGRYYPSFPLALAMRLLGARQARFTRT